MKSIEILNKLADKFEKKAQQNQSVELIIHNNQGISASLGQVPWSHAKNYAPWLSNCEGVVQVEVIDRVGKFRYTWIKGAMTGRQQLSQ